MSETNKAPALHPGDQILLYNTPSQSIGAVATVHAVHANGVCDARVTSPSGSAYRTECRYKYDPEIAKFGPDRWSQIPTGVWELTAGEKLRRELPARLDAIDAELVKLATEVARMTKTRK